MESHTDIEAAAHDLREHLRRVYRLRSGTLDACLRKGRRDLPKHVVNDGLMIVDALGKIGHPQLERTVDLTAISAAKSRIQSHLNSVNVWDRRFGALLRLTGVVALNVLIVAGMFISWMVWSGQL